MAALGVEIRGEGGEEGFRLGFRLFGLFEREDMDSTRVRTTGEPFGLKIETYGINGGVLRATAELLAANSGFRIEYTDNGAFLRSCGDDLAGRREL